MFNCIPGMPRCWSSRSFEGVAICQSVTPDEIAGTAAVDSAKKPMEIRALHPILPPHSSPHHIGGGVPCRDNLLTDAFIISHCSICFISSDGVCTFHNTQNIYVKPLPTHQLHKHISSASQTVYGRKVHALHAIPRLKSFQSACIIAIQIQKVMLKDV